MINKKISKNLNKLINININKIPHLLYFNFKYYNYKQLKSNIKCIKLLKWKKAVNFIIKIIKKS